jgi:hypothetical protein
LAGGFDSLESIPHKFKSSTGASEQIFEDNMNAFASTSDISLHGFVPEENKFRKIPRYSNSFQQRTSKYAKRPKNMFNNNKKTPGN